MKKENKREVASLVLYRKRGDTFEFFMEKRKTDAVHAPGQIGLFGGGLEAGESIDQALSRELQEELGYVPNNPRYFSRYEGARHINHVFIEEVGNGFEEDVVVHEAQYGKFFTLEEIRARDDFMTNSLLILQQVYRFLEEK